ncbi:MAG: winged helix-turn-helix domain-containing protein, partial [Nanoarchaeota archaeon]|nr:winged helix-turn-helix domain-containing protein [Nanoarchaeota archaeon]
MKKRSKLEVIYDLLKVVKNHNNFIKPTPLLRFSNLSSQNFSNYVKELVEKGLLENKKDKMGKKYFC